MLFSFLTIHLIAMGVEAELFATLAPPFHLPRERGGRTILVCLVSDAPRSDMVVTWLSRRCTAQEVWAMPLLTTEWIGDQIPL
ncbi:hypothetical protein AAFF_G00315730 [Aldrovandia affinis]|uniref:Secreted protein n=1 Tax=Aldrovandia affinis TaxID=143900 RepID=A0AAD7SNB9_9TELE|nr:hypothetical protein AAFF_G00315730 [Aldrovandia affinis]